MSPPLETPADQASRIEVRALAEDELGRYLAALARDVDALPYAYLRLDPERTAAAHIAGLRGGEAVRLEAVERGGGEPAAALVARPLPWDSAHFGFPVVRIDALFATGGDPARRVEACRSLVRELIARAEPRAYVFGRVAVANGAAILALQDEGFRVIETLLVYAARPEALDLGAAPGQLEVSRARADEVEALASIAATARNEHDRFHGDLLLDGAAVDRLFRAWIRNSFASGFADFVLAAREEGRPAGVLAGRLGADTRARLGVQVASVSLSAVASAGRGAYQDLLAGAIREFAAGGAEAIEYKTQAANVRVLHSLGKFGFRFGQGQLTLRRFVS